MSVPEMEGVTVRTLGIGTQAIPPLASRARLNVHARASRHIALELLVSPAGFEPALPA